MKNKMKPVLAAVLAMIFVLAALSACSGDKENSDGYLVFADTKGSDYQIVYPKGASNDIKTAADNLALDIKSKLGVEIPVVADSEMNSKKEILVGETNRQESVTAKEKFTKDDYYISVVGKKLCICALKDGYYKTAVTFLTTKFVNSSSFKLPENYEHTGSKVAAFKIDETVAESGVTSIDITVTPESNSSKPGIFVGREYDKGMFGYQGYCLVVSKGKLILYKFDKDFEEVMSKDFAGVKKGESVTIRMELEKKACRAYVLDDPAGVEPWPEFDASIKNCGGYNVGYIEMTGNGASYKDLKVSSSASANVPTYTNTVFDGYADPEVFYHQGKYYLYATGNGKGYRVHVSEDLVNWKTQSKLAVEPGLWGQNEKYWAPDVEYINGKFYMVVSCNEHLGIAVSDSPLGPFVANSQEALYSQTIDGHLFVDTDGTVYLYFVSWGGGRSYGIYGVKLDENMTPVKNTERSIIKPTEDWEKQDGLGSITEGPYMLKHNGTYYLTYSGSHFKSKNYAVGYAVSDKPLSGFKKYADNPIMIGNSKVSGVGHHCITTTPDSKEMIIVYHCHNTVNQVETRKICIDKMRFTPVKGGIDRLEVYGPTTTPQPYPIILPKEDEK